MLRVICHNPRGTVRGSRVYYIKESDGTAKDLSGRLIPAGVMFWDVDWNKYSLSWTVVDGSVPIKRVGSLSGMPVSAEEAEAVVGWPESGYEIPDNPVFDRLRELVHESRVAGVAKA